MLKRQAVVLVPGSVCDHQAWRHQVKHLAAVADPFVPAIDDADTMAELAMGVLDAAPDRFALAGFSMGGYVAQEMLRQAPHRITRLALLDTSARSDTADKIAAREATITACETGAYSDVIDEMLPVLLHPDRQQEPLADFVRKMMERIGAGVFAKRNRAMIGRSDSRDMLAAIAVPVRIICGRQDSMSSLDAHEEMARLAPQSRLSIIEECGHMSIIERPHAVSALLRDWLLYD
ncbi:MAG: alpha/beta fold hydrolase [Acidimicrobiia bacterium]